MAQIRILKLVQGWQVGQVVEVAGGLADFLINNGFAVDTKSPLPAEVVKAKKTKPVVKNKKVDTASIKTKAKTAKKAKTTEVEPLSVQS